MQLRWSLALLTAIIGSLWAGPALAWDQAKLQAQVQGLFDQTAAAFEKKDVQAILATSAPGATIKYRDGRAMDLAQWGEAVAREFADWQTVKTRFVVEKVWPKGENQAGAVYRERHEFTRISDPGHQHVIAARFRARLTKTPQGWRFLEFTDLGTRITRDGRPFDPKAAAKR